jgi:hypothetical protein
MMSATPTHPELSKRLARAHLLLRELAASASAPVLRVELDKLNADLEAVDILLSEETQSAVTLASSDRLLRLCERLLTILRVPAP